MLKNVTSKHHQLSIDGCKFQRFPITNCISQFYRGNGKQVLITPPPGTGSEFSTIKKTFYIISLL